MCDLMALQTLITQLLQTQRSLPTQVLDTLTDRYGQTEEQLPDYFVKVVPTLEEVDHDLIFSPAFTPTHKEKVQVFELLQDTVLTHADISTLIQRLKGTTVPFITPTGLSCVLSVPDVNLTRFITRLGVDKSIESDVYPIITQYQDRSVQAVLNLLARDSVWKGTLRQQLLVAFLTVLLNDQAEAAPLLTAMTDFVRTYRPDSLSTLDRQLESYIRSCESDLSRSGELHFHDEHLKEKYLLNEEGHRTEDLESAVRVSYLQMMDTGRSLRALCEQARKQCPGLLTPVR